LKLEKIKKNYEINYTSLNSGFKGRVIKKNEVPYLVNSVEGNK